MDNAVVVVERVQGPLHDPVQVLRVEPIKEIVKMFEIDQSPQNASQDVKQFNNFLPGARRLPELLWWNAENRLNQLIQLVEIIVKVRDEIIADPKAAENTVKLR